MERQLFVEVSSGSSSSISHCLTPRPLLCAAPTASSRLQAKQPATVTPEWHTCEPHSFFTIFCTDERQQTIRKLLFSSFITIARLVPSQAWCCFNFYFLFCSFISHFIQRKRQKKLLLLSMLTFKCPNTALIYRAIVTVLRNMNRSSSTSAVMVEKVQKSLELRWFRAFQIFSFVQWSPCIGFGSQWSPCMSLSARVSPSTEFSNVAHARQNVVDATCLSPVQVMFEKNR